jgi:hypothetical protein
MMETKIFEVLTGKITDQIRQHIESLSDGVAKDYANYKELCGAIRGLRTAQMEINDLVRKLKENEDD